MEGHAWAKDMGGRSGADGSETLPKVVVPALYARGTGNISVDPSVSPMPSNLEELAALLRQPASKFTQGDPRDLIRMRRRPVCNVCYNLDASEAPDNPSAWAQQEYLIPKETPAAHIKVPVAAELLESAKRGCVTCAMVAAALGAFAPGWEKEKTLIHIFIAANLPVVVQLLYGSLSTTTVSELPSDYGWGWPEGAGVAWDIQVTVQDGKKRPVEFEIYRCHAPLDQTTVGGTSELPFSHSPGQSSAGLEC